MPRNVPIQVRRGTSSEWSVSNPVLSAGEPGFDSTNNVLKLGDGSTAWSGLSEIGSFSEVYYGDLDGAMILECRNDTGSDISAGTPVYVSGYYSANGKALIAPADAANVSKMPAIGILENTITNGSEGIVHCFGLASGFNTNSFSVGDTVYVASGGGLTATRPTSSSVLIQNIGRVLRSDISQGRILVLGPGRTNDVPNNATFVSLTTDSLTYNASKPTITTNTDGATINFNMNSADVHTVVLGGNRTLALSNVAAGQRFIIRLTQDSTGSRTVTWFSGIKWPGNLEPTLTTAANKTDVFGFICTTTGNYDGFVIGYNL